VINPGFHHVALVRAGSTLKMFIDGVQEGGDLAVAGAVNNVNGPLSIGRNGDENFGADWQGWVDEFRLCVGQAKYNANFRPEDYAFDQFDWKPLGPEQMPADDQPMIWRFAEITLVAARLRMSPPALAIPQVAVMYAGQVLQLERRIYVGHRVMSF